MALVINTNIASIQSERALATNRGNMEQAMQRLSSGKRINSAIDDAAGIAVTQRMRNQIQGLNMAIRNGGDGISMAQTAEGAIDEIQNMLHRMRELAVQASNGTYTSEDRSFLSVEFNELVKEIRRVSNQAAWDGDLKLISEDAKAMNVQVGISTADYIKIPLGPLTIEQLNLAQRTTINNSRGAQINTFDLTASTAGAIQNTLTYSGVSGSAILDKDSNVTDTRFIDVPLPNFELKLWDGSRNPDGTPTANTVTLTAAGVASVSDLVEQLKGHRNYDPTTVELQNVGGQLKVVWKIFGSPMPATELRTTNTDLSTGTTGIQTFADSTSTSLAPASLVNLSTTATDFRPQTFDLSTIKWFEAGVPTSPPNFFEFKVGTRTLSAHNVTSIEDLRKQLKEDSDYEFVRKEAGLPDGYEMFNVSSGTTLAARFGTNAHNMGFLRFSESNVNIANTRDAITTLDFIDKAHAKVNTMRAQMGATMSRIEYTINNLMNIVENTEEAKSRILDTDYARESAALAKAQVLAQAGTAMLAQANQSQQYVLNLLRQG